MTTNPNPRTTEEEDRLVYQAVAAVASVCDGALSRDYQGFNGQDTKYGKRVASVPYEQWTDDVKDESARMILKYKDQVLALTGIDVTKLTVVRDAQHRGTNHVGRRQAYDFEARSKAMSNRICDVNHNSVLYPTGTVLSFSWDRDPDFSNLLAGAQVLPGRRYNRSTKGNEVFVTTEAEDFALLWDFKVTPAAEALLAKLADQPAPVVTVTYNINLDERTGRLTIKAPYDAARVTEARALPGREWSPPGFDKMDVVNPTPQVLDFAKRWKLTIHPDAEAAIEQARKAMEAADRAALAEEDFRTLMIHVSRVRSPEQLPPAFLEMLEEVLALA